MPHPTGLEFDAEGRRFLDFQQPAATAVSAANVAGVAPAQTQVQAPRPAPAPAPVPATGRGADIANLNTVLAGRTAQLAAPVEPTTAEKFQKFATAMQFFSSAFSQFQGGPNTDPVVAQHRAAVGRAQQTSGQLVAQTKAATDLTKFVTENIAPDKQVQALAQLGRIATNPEDIAAIRQAGLGLANPRAIADVRAGAGAVAKLGEIKTLIDASQDPRVLEGMGLSKDRAKQFRNLLAVEGGLGQLATMANTLPPDNPLHISDEQLLQLQTNPKVLAAANQVLGAQPLAAFQAGQTVAAQEAAKAPGAARIAAAKVEAARVKAAAPAPPGRPGETARLTAREGALLEQLEGTDISPRQRDNATRELTRVQGRLTKLTTVTGTTEQDPSFTATQIGKRRLDLEAGERNVSSLIRGANRVFDLLDQGGAEIGFTGGLVSATNTVAAQAKALARVTGKVFIDADTDREVSADTLLNPKKYDFGELSKLGQNAARVQATMLNLAFSLASQQNKGRISDRDVQAALTQLGGSVGNKDTLKAILQDRIGDTIAGFNFQRQQVLGPTAGEADFGVELGGPGQAAKPPVFNIIGGRLVPQ